MTILAEALNQIKLINKNQRIFFITLIQGLIGIAGKRTFRNLARYMEITEHTFSRQMKKAFDFIGLNMALIKELNKDNDELIAVQDSTFIRKSGKTTYGLGFVWNGSASKTEKGLEVDVIAVVDVTNKNNAYTISAEQIPASTIQKKEKAKETMSTYSKIDFAVNHVKKVLSQLMHIGVKYIAADAFFAKEKYVNGIVSTGLHVISRLRIDARLRKLYSGEQKSRGRRKKFDNGKFKIDDFKDSPIIQIVDKGIELQSAIVHSVSLDRSIKVVLVRKKSNNNEYKEVLLFSTDLELDALKIYEYYVARFQIEFIFRDAKGFTGFTDCQSRDPKRMHYHFNASLTALNIVKIQDAKSQKNKSHHIPFSMASWTRKYHVDIVINRFISMFKFDQTFIKSHPYYNKLLSLGEIDY